MIKRLVLATALVLAGCSTQQIATQSFDVAVRDAHLSTLASIDNWKISGRLGVRTNKGGHIGRVVWTRKDNYFQIDLYGSLASGHLRVTSQPGRAELVDSEGAHLVGSTAEEVLEQYVGWRFPVVELESWIIGAAYPGTSALQEWDSLGHMNAVEQAGWRVLLSNYGEFDGYQLPTRFRMIASESLQQTMEVQRPGGVHPAQIRLVINGWTVNSIE